MTIETLELLVVDGVAAMRDATTDQLRVLSLTKVRLASDATQALQALRQQPVDLVLCADSTHAADLLQEMREDDRLCRVPVLMITAEAEHDEVARAIAAGVSGVLVRPYTLRQLESKTAAALGRDAAADLPDRPPDSAALRPTILVVDDAPDNLRLVANLFERQYRVRVADSGERALAICTADTPPDVVLLDVMMPGLDGFEVARRMREHPNSAHIPVIFVTALSDDRARRRGLDLGAVDFVSKPIDPDVLQIRVGNFMRYVLRHKQRQAECDALVAAGRLRDEVEQMLRHDLKSPLSGVVGLARLLSRHPGLDADQACKIRLIEETTLHALDTVNMSSEVFKIETGRYRLDPSPVPVVDILRQTVDLARAGFAAKRLSIELNIGGSGLEQEGPDGLGDPALCRSVLHNLIKNACEAAPAGGWVTVSLLDEAPLQIVIRNRGAVPVAVRPTFFERYASDGKRGGAGLGTYSAKLLTEAQGGSIHMSTSDEDDTTTLRVSLPRAPARSAALQRS